MTLSITDDNAAGSRFPWLATGGALCAEAGALTAGLGHVVLAGALILATSLVLTLLATRYFVLSTQQLVRRLLASTLTVILATAFLLVLRASRGFGTFGLRFHPQSSRGIARVPKRVSGDQTRGSALAEAGDAHPGIILRPQKQTYTKFITPAPISFKPRPFSTDRADPLIIPFDGVYWIFKAPDVRLPANSREARGSPEMFSIRSNDRQPSTMEAHQNLGTRVSMDCCSRIQIAIKNADRYPQSVSLELVLIDTTAPSKPYLSLGRAAVNSTRPWTLYGNRLTTSETLNFGMPPHSAMRRFDEVMIIFRLNAERADAEAKIGIDHFMFVPRGL